MSTTIIPGTNAAPTPVVVPDPARRHPLTPAERSVRGKEARRRLPLADHAACDLPDLDALALLKAEDTDRVQELLPIRYERMLASAFAYYRGSATVMAADLAQVPNSELDTQLCGDAHLSNFGVYRSPERRLAFDVNDFDETLPGPFEWDVKRLAASLVLAGRNNGHDRAERAKTVTGCVAAYRTAMREFATQGNLKVWYAGVDVEQLLADLLPKADRKQRKTTEANLDKARRNDSLEAIRKLTETVDGRTRFRSEPPLLVPVEELLPDHDAAQLQELLRNLLGGYRETLSHDRRHLLDEYELVQVARKVVGVGSVGTRAWVLLLTGRDSADPLVLQAKEAGPSVLEPFLGASRYDNAGERVVSGQRLMQATSDIFLGWQTMTGVEDGLRHDYYVRQLRDGKASALVDRMKPRVLRTYGEVCAWTLARAHARAGDRIAIASYLGKQDTFDRAVAEFAESYADRAEDQYRQLKQATST